MIKTVKVSDFYESATGLKESARGFPVKTPFRIFGADTETVRGVPHTFQICSEGEDVIERVNAQTIFPRFMTWLEPRLLDRGANYVFFHNLRFDLTILFNTDLETIYHQYNDITLRRNGYVVKMFYGRVNMALVRKDEGLFKCKTCGELPAVAVKAYGRDWFCANGQAHPKGLPRVTKILGPAVHWIDSAAFCPPGSRSLAAALKIYGVPYKKMAAPEGLGQRPLWDDSFQSYALNDARAEEALGVQIMARHKEYDIAPCVSLPQMAGKILRHHFFQKGERLLYPPADCRHAAELSYHAGKNGFYAPRGFYEALYEYDINSAFPKAMREMPSLCKGKYARVKTYRPGLLGLYLISGNRLGGTYPIVYDHAFKVVGDPAGPFERLWVTGFEIDILQKDPNYIFKVHEGWVFRHDKTYKHSPLQAFVDHFWKLKNETPKGPLRDFYKNILNSLYGKFAACRENRPVIETAWGPMAYDGYWDEPLSGPGSQRHYIAGALYHPFIATQITGYVRRELFLLEQRAHALHAATDSVKSRLDLVTSNDLGGIKKEVYGNCYLFRNKLYLHFARDTSLCGHDLEKGWLYVSKKDGESLPVVGRDLRTGKTWNAREDVFKGKIFDRGQHLCKYGLHGFKGSVFYLYRNRYRLLRNGALVYAYDHMVNLREGIKRGQTVSDMVEREECLTL